MIRRTTTYRDEIKFDKVDNVEKKIVKLKKKSIFEKNTQVTLYNFQLSDKKKFDTEELQIENIIGKETFIVIIRASMF